jgi:hypothetical protein
MCFRVGTPACKNTDNAELVFRNQATRARFSLKEGGSMASSLRLFGYFTSCALILLVMATTGCAHRYYDNDHNDYHRWNRNETVYYNQWVIESRIEPHRQYRDLSREDQKRYWEWRHNHHDHDRDQGRDRHHR